MTKHPLFVLVCIGAALAACGKKKATPAAGKAVDQAVDKPSPVAPTAAGSNKIGGIDLDAATVDLVALFPDAKVVLRPAEEGESVYDTRDFDTVAVVRGDRTLLEAELEANTDRITSILVFDASISTPGGLDVGKPIAELAARHPDVTCLDAKMSSSCSGPSTGKLSYQIDAEHGTGGPFGEDVPVARVQAGATIAQVRWSPGEGATGPKLAKRPPIVAGEAGGVAADADAAPRKPAADEIDRCARVYAAVKACGVGHDNEFGWIASDKKKVSPADARKLCSVDATTDEDGMSAFPVPVLEADQVARLEAAAKKGCKAVTDTLDEVSPGIGLAGYDPSK